LGGNRSCPIDSQPAATTAATSDLISFLKALPGCRMRRGVRWLISQLINLSLAYLVELMLTDWSFKYI
jgi:hypothetical protein